MAKTRSKLWKRRVLGFDVEATTGTEVTLASDDYNLESLDPQIKFDATGEAIEGHTLNSRTVQPGVPTGTIEFGHRLSGSGTAELPPIVNVLTCCGFKLVNSTLTPQTQTDVGNTGTFALNRDGVFKSLAGVMLNAVFTGEVGKAVMVKFSGKGKRFTGDLTKPRDASMVAPTYLDVAPPTLRGVTFEIGGDSMCVPGFELDLGCDVQLRECITDETGILAAQITGLNPRFTISKDMLPISTEDFYSMYEAAESVSLLIEISNDEESNTIIIEAPKLVLFQPPEDEDSNGFYRNKLVFIPADDAGDDHLTIEFPLDS